MRQLPTLVFSGLCLLAASASAQDYPSKSIDLVLTSGPGSSVELIGRAFAEALSKELGQTVVPVNKPGGANTVGTIIVANSPADGYTLGFTASGPFVSQPYLQKLPYEVDDFEYICQLVELQVTLAVAESSPYQTLGDVIEAAKANPGKINVATTGIASIPHIVISDVEHLAGVQFNFISYQGDSAALQAMLGGEIDMVGLALGTVANQPVRVLATFGRSRTQSHPDVPTGTELDLPIIKVGMVGLFAPKPLPEDVRARLDTACQNASQDEVFRAMAQNMNQPIEYVDGPEWERRIAEDAEGNKAAIERLGISPQ
jgi:tripartite-type tricarboxylate transporter receptor subunit TctC